MMAWDELVERINDPEVKAVVAKYIGNGEPKQPTLPGFGENEDEAGM